MSRTISLHFGCTAIAASLLLSSVSSDLAAAQSPGNARSEIGQPMLTCYRPEVTDGHIQSWAFLQDDSGILYVGNGAGLLEFDGSSWRTILIANRQFVRSLAQGDDGRIYVGSSGEIGYLGPDSVGRASYVSLLQYLPEEDRKFKYVWSIHAASDGIYFQANERLFRFRKDGDGWSVKSWTPTGTFAYTFLIDDTLYVHESGVGFSRLEGDSLRMLPGGEQFAMDRIHLLLKRGEGPERNGRGQLIVGTFTRGLFLFDGQTFRPWDVPASALFEQVTPYSAVALPGGRYAVGTLQGGLVLMDSDGRILDQMTRDQEVPSNSVLSVALDREGGVWFAPENAICRIPLSSPITVFDASRGIQDLIFDFFRFDGRLYTSSSAGIYYLDHATGRFQSVGGLLPGNQQAWQFAEVDGSLLVATGEGVQEIVGVRARPVRRNESGLSYASISIHTSRANPKRAFVGLFSGLASLLKQDDGTWLDEGSVEGIEEYIADIIELTPGTLWLSTASGFTYRLKFDEDAATPARVEVIDSTFGITEPENGVLVDAADDLFWVDESSVYRYDPENDHFEPDSLFDRVGRREKLEYIIRSDQNENLWASFGRETAFFRRLADGSYRQERTTMLRYQDAGTVSMFGDSDGVVWFGTRHGVLRYDPSLEQNFDASYSAMIREVTAGGSALSLTPLAASTALLGRAAKHRIGPDQNNMRFAFSAASLDRPQGLRYQSILEGFDKDWSPWSQEGVRGYTNLPPGDYTFRVRARNVYGVESAEAAFPFVVMPPWFQTWWAYAFYVLAAGAGVWMFVRFRTSQLQSRSRELEAVVDQRTHELREQKENVEVLSRIGRDLTASLDIETIFTRLYENVNRLLDATIFGVGIYDASQQVIEYRLAVERGKRYAPYTRDMQDKNQLPVWCIDHREPVLIRDYDLDYGRYIEERDDHPEQMLEDGSISETPRSLMYSPLIAKDRILGVLTVQSFEPNAYGDYEMSILQTLGAYTSVALDNAHAYARLNETLEHLKAAQQQLIQQEKLASLGSMTAGIAHEIKNPLNFVNNFAALSVELVDEIEESLQDAMQRVNGESLEQLQSALTDLRLNCEKIEEHGQRANGIVRSMLEHSRGTGADRREVDVNLLVDEYLNLAFHGIRAQNSDFNCKIERDLDTSIGAIQLAPQEIGRVLINLLNNAFYAVMERAKVMGPDYSPVVRAETHDRDDSIEIVVRDNGGGIPQKVRDRIFEPFFTTKPPGEGTGLGLSLSYEIVTQGHGGSLDVVCEDGESTEFRIVLPKNASRIGSESVNSSVSAS